MAEDAKFDSLFLADGPALTGNGAYRPPGQLEPFTLLTALSQHTSRIGLIATVSSTYNEPYNLARRLASVDHVSGGRAGWNIVTSAGADEAANFGLDQRPDHAARYDRVDEFLTVAKALWDSWEREAVHADKASGRYARRAAPTPVVAVVGLNGMTARTRLFSQIYAVAELSEDDTADDPVSHRCTSTADRCRHRAPTRGVDSASRHFWLMSPSNADVGTRDGAAQIRGDDRSLKSVYRPLPRIDVAV